MLALCDLIDLAIVQVSKFLCFIAMIARTKARA
jgi:hypothetical protein